MVVQVRSLLKFSFAACLILLSASKLAQAQTSTLSGILNTANFQAITGATMTFGLSQAGVIAGSNNIATSSVSCYTAANNGSIVGVPDPPIAPNVSLIAGSLAAGTYYIQITYYFSSGETLPSPYSTIVLAAPGGIQIASPVLQPTPASGYNVYIGTTSSNGTRQIHQAGFSTSSQTSALSAGAAIPTSNTSVCSLAANDSIIPSYTTYHVNVLDKVGQQVAGFPQDWYLVSGTVDITQQLPIAVNVRVRFPQPIIANPNSAAAQSVNSPLVLNGYGLQAGSIVLPINLSPPTPAPSLSSGYSTIYTDSSNNLNLCSGLGTCWTVGQSTFNVQSMNNIAKCDQFAGGTAGAKIAACIASLPSTGGTADARGLQGAQSVTQNVFASATGKVMLLLGYATYTATVGQTVKYGGSSIIGMGQNATIWKFAPTGAATALTWQATGGVVIAQGKISGFTLDATGNTQLKTGINIVDAEELEVSDIAISNWSDGTKSSTGIRIQGRQNLEARRWTINADQPVRISIDPNTGIVAADHLHFQDMYTIADITQPNWLVDDGVFMTNVTWDGYQAWVAGSYGLYWNDVSGASNSRNIHIENVRWEQDCAVVVGCTVPNNGYALYISPNHQLLGGLNIINNYSDSAHKGFYIRNAKAGQFVGNVYEGLTEAINLDSSSSISVRGNFFDFNAGATKSIGAGFTGTWCDNDITGLGIARGYCGFGGNTSVDAALVVPNLQGLSGRKADNSANVPLIAIDGSNNVAIGSGGANATFGGQITLSSGVQVLTGSGVPAINCTIGSIFLRSDPGNASQVEYVCYPANTWTAVTVP